MHGFYIEQRTLQDGNSLTRDLAQHIFMRGARGAVVVATDRPHDLQSTTKKQWNALVRLVQRERASTLKLTRIAQLSDQLAWMQRVRFTSKLPDELLESSVVFASIEDLVRRPPICSTLYVTEMLSKEQFHLLTSWMGKEGVVVYYN